MITKAPPKGGAILHERGDTMRKLMWFAVGFGCAAILCAYGWTVSFLWVALAFVICAIGLLIGCHWKRLLRIPGVLLLAFSVGIGWFWVHDNLYLADARSLDGKIVTAEVEITDFSYQNDYGWAVAGKAVYEGKSYNVLLYLKEAVELKPGDTVNGTFKLRFTADGGNREPTYHRSQGIFLLGYQEGEITTTASDGVPAKYALKVWKQALSNRITDLLPADAAAFIKALLVGERVDIDYETNTAFKVSGISHIIAVSGLHMGVLFGAVYALCLRNRWLSGIVGIPVMILFAVLVGFTPSVTRACIMQCVMLIGLMLNKEYDPPTALAASVFVMILGNPMVVISISFQLSVSCMIGIFLLSDRVRNWLLKRKYLCNVKGRGILPRLRRWFVSSVSVSISASIITVPLVAYYFQTISLVSLLTNLLTVWIVSYIFTFSAAALVLSVVSIPAAHMLTLVIAAAVRFVTGTARFLSRIPIAAVYTQSTYILIWVIVAYLLLLVFLFLKKRPVLIYSISVTLTLCLALFLSWLIPRMDECRVTVLNVGQGQCILLQSGEKTFLVDCGGDTDTGSADLAVQTLLSQCVFKLDGVILTHYDEDHAGGVSYLLTRMDTAAVFLPDIADKDHIMEQIDSLSGGMMYTVSEDTVLTYGNTKITLFAPENPDGGNESSLCVLFQTENCDILITGDRGAKGEKLLLQRAELPQIEVLIAGHHGSANSTGDALLAETRPQMVAISVGRNPYGHPAEALLERLAEYGCKVYRTDQRGTLIFRR